VHFVLPTFQLSVPLRRNDLALRKKNRCGPKAKPVYPAMADSVVQKGVTYRRHYMDRQPT
jgi:hypothetical protein